MALLLIFPIFLVASLVLVLPFLLLLFLLQPPLVVPLYLLLDHELVLDEVTLHLLLAFALLSVFGPDLLEELARNANLLEVGELRLDELVHGEVEDRYICSFGLPLGWLALLVRVDLGLVLVTILILLLCAESELLTQSFISL